ncbi:hypothetical protein KJ782_04835 [Patescibacteria group bacterium]|nr:hypothetical protein [Patescibacteria group bacterium]
MYHHAFDYQRPDNGYAEVRFPTEGIDAVLHVRYYGAWHNRYTKSGFSYGMCGATFAFDFNRPGSIRILISDQDHALHVQVFDRDGLLLCDQSYPEDDITRNYPAEPYFDPCRTEFTLGDIVSIHQDNVSLDENLYLFPDDIDYNVWGAVVGLNPLKIWVPGYANAGTLTFGGDEGGITRSIPQQWAIISDFEF